MSEYYEQRIKELNAEITALKQERFELKLAASCASEKLISWELAMQRQRDDLKAEIERLKEVQHE